MKRTKLLLIPVFLTTFISAWGQEIQSNAWKAWFTDYSLTSSTTLRLETHYRTKDFFATRDQILIRPGVTYTVAPGASITAGVTYIANNLGTSTATENNLWQQFGFSFPMRNARFLGWIRAEQRWIKRPNSAVSFSHRIRFRTGFSFPLTALGTSPKNEFLAFNEVFMNFKKGFPYQFNQNWTFFGLQKKLSPKANLLTGFQRISVNGAQRYIHKNIWSTIVFYKL